MAPKQATLGYVKPSQKTLSKFFGGPNGSKLAVPQQSKLAFGSKGQVKDRKNKADGEKVESEPEDLETRMEGENVEVKREENEDVNIVEDDKDDELETSSTGRSNASDAKAGPDRETERSTSGSPLVRKRTSKDQDNSDQSEDEPPTKKSRTKPSTGTKNLDKCKDEGPGPSSPKPKSSVSTKKNARKTVNFNDDIDNLKSFKVDAKRRANMECDGNNSSLGAPKGGYKEQRGSEAKDAAKNPSEQLDKDKLEDDDEEKSEYDECEDSEDEKPEVAAKARAQVQTTLTGKSKDPYPDWKPGDPVPFAALCTTFSKIEMTTKRLEIQAHCSLFLRQVLRLTPKDLLPTVLLMVNKLAADYAGIELGIGESLIMKAIGETTGRSLAIVKSDQNEIGDLGLVAAKSRSNQPTMFKPKPLTVRGVHDGLMKIATTSEGQGSQSRKVDGIKRLLAAADTNLLGKGSKGFDITKDKGGPSEAKFIIRALEGKMRLGLAEKSVLVALSQAMVMHEALQKNGKPVRDDQMVEGESILKSVYNELPSYEVVLPALLDHGIFNLRESCKLRPGVPLKPMLAKPTKSITEVLDRFEGKDFTCEYKYDGARSQIHFVSHDSNLQYATAIPSAGKSEKGLSNVFSRNSEDLSDKYPDILQNLPAWVKHETKSFVLDSETVAWDAEEKKVLPFQELMKRKRKDVKVEELKIKVCVFAFDLLFLNGEALVNKPFRERRSLMQSAFNPIPNTFAFAQYGDTNDLDQIQTLLESSVSASCEGLMVKMLDGVPSHYEPSRRSQNWLKVKKDYLSGAGDSLDLVVLGAYHGKGKRTSWYGAFLLGCYNPAEQTFESVCNVGTGFSEAVLEELHARLADLVIDRPKPFYAHSEAGQHQPDVWFEARLVWEVKTADLTLSPRYRAAAGEMAPGSVAGAKGVSLRFPRFLNVREDKKPEEATTSRAVAEMYKRQEGVAKAGAGAGPSVDDDFEY